MNNRLLSIDEQRALERSRIEEVKNRAKSLDTQVSPVIDQAISPEASEVDVVGQVVDVTKYKYDRIKVRGPDGKARYTAGNKDAVAKSMLGMTKQEVYDAGSGNGLTLDNHFKLRNDGHFRMIVGQALRSIVIKGGTVTLRGVVIKALDQSVPWPKGYAEEKKGTTQKPIRRQPPSANRIKD